MSTNQVCVYCSKECKSSDSKPHPNSKSKNRIHNRCYIKKSLADKQQRVASSSKQSDPSIQQVTPTSSESKISSSFSLSSVNLVDKLKEDNDRIRNEANAQKLNKLITDQEQEAKKARKDASFFFDIKAGIAKPHEKRQFLHHRNICEIAPRFNDHGHQEESIGRSVDSSGKDLNSLGDDSDEETTDNASVRQQSDQLKAGGSVDVDHLQHGKRKLRTSDHNEAQKKAKNTLAGLQLDEKNPCWFCLSSPRVEKHLIIVIGDYCYLTLAKGGLVDEHLLIIPIEHIQSVNDPANSPELLRELDDFKRSLVSFFGSKSMAVVFFERNFRSVHWQIQVIPVSEALLDDLPNHIKSISKLHFNNANYIDIPGTCTIGDMIPAKAPYLFWQIEPSGQAFICQIEVKNTFFPIQLPRMVLAAEQIMNCQDRVDWKECTKSQDDYIELVKSFKQQYQDFDIT